MPPGLNHLLAGCEYADGIALRTHRAMRESVDNREGWTGLSVNRPAKSESRDEAERGQETAQRAPVGTEGSTTPWLDVPRNRCRHRELLLGDAAL